MTPIQIIALGYIAGRRDERDPTTGRRLTVDLRKISEPMRQRIIDLAMMEPPLVDVDADQVFLTGAGYVKVAELRALERTAGEEE